MGACKLVQDKKTSVAGVTLYTEGDCIKPTGVYLPPSHTAACGSKPPPTIRRAGHRTLAVSGRAAAPAGARSAPVPGSVRRPDGPRPPLPTPPTSTRPPSSDAGPLGR